MGQVPVISQNGSSQQTGFLSFADVVKNAAPSVVSIQTQEITYDVFLQPVPAGAAGSGVIIDSGGIIVTNNHVVEGATSVIVTLSDGQSYQAVNVFRDLQTDLAIVEIEADNLPVATLGRSQDLRVGDWVLAIGNALALEGGSTVTAGIVSYLGRSILLPNNVTLYDLIQTDAAINPGNSGGALVNMNGEVVGINTAVLGEAQNIGFAINISGAQLVLEQLVANGSVIRAGLLATYIDVTPTVMARYRLSVSEGAVVFRVQVGGPADRAGIRPGDVVVAVAGRKVTSAEQLRRAVQSFLPGDIVEVTFVRGTQQQTVRLTLTVMP